MDPAEVAETAAAAAAVAAAAYAAHSVAVGDLGSGTWVASEALVAGDSGFLEPARQGVAVANTAELTDSEKSAACSAGSLAATAAAMAAAGAGG